MAAVFIPVAFTVQVEASVVVVFPAVAAAAVVAVRGDFYLLLLSKSLITSEARIKPTTGGTKGVEPGMLLEEGVSWLTGGNKGERGCSFE